ncbi:hypothetical protein SEA_SADLAD_91 [Microbacterium phage SadLad]|nr:hypothetical protein SEA_SADLAD_91 [Microbacterium phage SadLad]
MKYIIRAEDNDTGQIVEKEVELRVGESAASTFPTSLGERVWNILDVTPIGENETLDPDPRFPNRPTHPDFARLSSAVIEQDAIADMLGLEQAAKFDLASATYLARGRVEMMGFAGAHENVIMRITMLYLDALNLGIGFAERGGHRPAETGTAGDKEGSL